MRQLTIYFVLALISLCAGCKNDEATSAAFDQHAAVEQFNNSIVGNWTAVDTTALRFMPKRFSLQKTAFDSGVYSSQQSPYSAVYGIVFSPDWPEKSTDPKFGIMLLNPQSRAVIQTMMIPSVKADTLIMTYIYEVTKYKRL